MRNRMNPCTDKLLLWSAVNQKMTKYAPPAETQVTMVSTFTTKVKVT